MAEFKESYAKLNTKQKQAVDQIEGPVLVLAGPGTGKTQLLSTRVANILQKTDISSNNILCLTYTEAGATAMRQRLADVIGEAGYQVSVSTFHGFALEVMRQFPDYFLERRGAVAVDELTSYLILEEILADLPPNFKLAHRTFARENRISELTSKISELKKNALSPALAKELAIKNADSLQKLSDLLSLIPYEMPKKKADQLGLIEDLTSYLQTQTPELEDDSSLKSLRNVILEELTLAVSEALESGKTTAITKFKDSFLEKDLKGSWLFKDSRYNQNLQELAHIYKLYDAKLKEMEKLEFDDMILGLLSAMSNNPDLKFNIQERWQYILVDEFQDTSFAQLELIRLLGDNPTNDSRPNIMVVGDDDQAIYAFQGASVSNIQRFINLYPDTELITLEENYRSNQTIINSSFETAKFIEERPAGTDVKELKKESKTAKDLDVSVVTLTSSQAELSWLCRDIKEQIQNGHKMEQIAVLAPRHRYLQELASELTAHKVPVYYESSSNILEDEIILELLSLSSLVLKISQGELAHSNSLLAEVLSAPYWKLETGSIWKLALHARSSDEPKHWLEHLADGALGKKGEQIYAQLISWAEQVGNLSLEQSLDLLIGVNEVTPAEEDSTVLQRSFSEVGSPFKNHYFSKNKLTQEPAHYASFLSSISTLRENLRTYFPDLSKPKLKDLLIYIELCQAHGGIRLTRRGLHIKPTGVNLITAYGSKGLEFEKVYIMHASEDVWSEAARGKVDTLKLTANFSGHKDTSDDKTRLFYVAQTRAKDSLVHTLHKFDEKGKEKILLRYLDPLKTLEEVKFIDLSDDLLEPEQAAEAYQQKLFPLEPEAEQSSVLADILAPILEDYRLSATHLTTWLDPVYGGKDEFITRHLLRFPQAMSESAVHGSAVHKALEKAHLSSEALEKGGQNIQSLLLTTYQQELTKCALDPKTKTRMLDKAKFLFENLSGDILSLVKVEAIPELDIKTNFKEVKLSGKLDALVINREEGTAVVRDYKTGKPGKYIDPRYKNQLYLYKLLLDCAPERLPKDIKLTGAELVYLNPSEDSVVTLSLNYKESEYEDFKELILRVWHDILALGKS